MKEEEAVAVGIGRARKAAGGRLSRLGCTRTSRRSRRSVTIDIHYYSLEDKNHYI